MKCTKSGASTIVAGKEFHAGIVFGKKLYLNVSDLAGYCRSFFECFVCLFDFLRPGQHFFSYVRRVPDGLSHAVDYKARINVSCSRHNTLTPLRLESSTLSLSHCAPFLGV